MKFKPSKEYTVGLTVVLLAVAMYWLVFFLKGKDIFNRFCTYHTAYENVEGLVATSPVYLRGLKIGTIGEIAYDQQQDRFEVSLLLESAYKIPDNSAAQIYSTDLLGTKAVRIIMGDSPQFLADRDTLASALSLDLMAYLGRELPALREQIGEVLTGLETVMGNVNVVLGNENQARLQHSLDDLSATLHNFRNLSAYLNTEVPQIRSILMNINKLVVDLGASADNIGATFSNLKAFTDTLRQADVAILVQNLDHLVSRLQDPDGSVGQLLNGDEAYRKITRLLENVDNLVSNISQNPKKYLKISVF